MNANCHMGPISACANCDRLETENTRLRAYAKHERSLGAEGPMIELISAKQEIERLQALLHELADDLESELLGRYKTLEGKMRPIEQRRFERDMGSVRRARRALERRKVGPPDGWKPDRWHNADGEAE